MLALLALAVMGVVAYAMLREGLFGALCHTFGIIFAGLLAFHFWPPLANEFEPSFQGSVVEGLEDAIALLGVFALTLGLLRVVTNVIADQQFVDIPPKIMQAGGATVGAIGGFFLAGFLGCVLQTLPWYENFLGFPAHDHENTGFATRKFPPDQLWLKMMNRAHTVIFQDDDAFRKETELFTDFSRRYAKHRRYTETRDPLPYVPPKPPGPALADPNKKDPPKKDPEPKKDPDNMDPKKEPDNMDPKKDTDMMPPKMDM